MLYFIHRYMQYHDDVFIPIQYRVFPTFSILKLINQRMLEELKSQWWAADQKECPKLENESDGIR